MRSADPHSGEQLPGQYSFGDFTLDLQYRVLRRGGEEVILRLKSFEVLAYLVDHHGQLVTKAKLMEAVWRDTAVTDNSLAQCMVEIRRALDNESQQLIRTVARQGYLFAAPVTTPVVEFPPRSAVAPAEPPPVPVTAPAPVRRVTRRYGLGAGVLVLAALALAAGSVLILLQRQRRAAPARLEYVRLTNFADSATSPALSPDSRILAFIRGITLSAVRARFASNFYPMGSRCNSRMTT